MDPFHEYLARIALDEVPVLQLHPGERLHDSRSRLSQLLAPRSRPSPPRRDKSDFSQAQYAVAEAYLREGLAIKAEVFTSSFSRMDVRATWTPWDSAKVELGRGSRKNEPISLVVRPGEPGGLYVCELPVSLPDSSAS